MTSLFRPWTKEIKAAEKHKIDETGKSEVDAWLSAKNNDEKKFSGETVGDREVRYSSVIGHVKKGSEKCLLKRRKISDDVSPGSVTKVDIRDSRPSGHIEAYLPEISYPNNSIAGCRTFLDGSFGPFPMDLLPEESHGSCYLLPSYCSFRSGLEATDATIAQGISSNLFEEYARFLTEQQKQVAERTRKQRPKKFRCPQCQVGFSNNGQLKGHIRIHTGERPFKCDAEACGKSFTRNEELTRHRRIHSGLRPFPCPECGKRFGRKDHLKKHVKTHFQQRYQLVPILSSHCSIFGYGGLSC